MPTSAPLTRLILPAVAAIIFDKRGHILLQRRRDVDKWGLIGGHVEFGETIEQAVHREIKEETNLSVRIDKLIGVYSEPASQTYQYVDRSVQYVTTYFRGFLLDELSAGYYNQETVALGLFAPEALPKELAQLNTHWLQDALSSTATPFVR